MVALTELPKPLPGQTGWPWDQASNQLPKTMGDGSKWPRISIITPSLNQGEFIEETIRSVLLQAYPNLEYIIIDGGSSDETVTILKKYQAYLTYWVSEPDRGQSHAINKGLERVTGDLIGWLNSDDYYEPQTLELLATEYSKTPKQSIIIGAARLFSDDGTEQRDWLPKRVNYWPLHYQSWLVGVGASVLPCQPSVFFTKDIVDEIGLLREDLKLAMDYEYWLRAKRSKIKFNLVNKRFSHYRFHDNSLSIKEKDQFINEWRIVSDEYWQKFSGYQKLTGLFWKAANWLRIGRLREGDNAYAMMLQSMNKSLSKKQRIAMLIKSIKYRPPIITTRMYWAMLKHLFN